MYSDLVPFMLCLKIRPQDSKGPMGLIQQVRGPPGEAVSI